MNNDIFGFIRPSIDAHTLGIFSVSQLLKDCGYRVIIADVRVTDVVAKISKTNNLFLFKKWIIENGISRLGFSYRLDPISAQENFGRIIYLLNEIKVLDEVEGPIKSVYFAGLPEACQRIKIEYNGRFPIFIGDETPTETLQKIGVPYFKIPNEILKGSEYDEFRLKFGKELIEKESYLYRSPFDISGYPNFGTRKDTVISRIKHRQTKRQLPLIRVHVGPYNPNYIEALKEFQSWLKELANDGWLDIVSIGSSQLSQSDFGANWGDKPNGGGVPINSELDLINIWEASRPMLVRTYAGTKNIPNLARIYENTINIAWHALSFWWFCEIDGRGSYTVKYNLEQHIETLKIIAATGKPFEANVPHHFAFRGADDYSYVLSGYLAAKTAKKYGIRFFIIQNMLNTPKHTWGFQDLAKSRALFRLIKELEDEHFTVFLQPRAGLDYFSPDLEKAKAQLAAVTALMDDIVPSDEFNPDIIHVVSYSEAIGLATPKIINESIKITFEALESYRRLKKQNKMENMQLHRDTNDRTFDIYNEVKKMVFLIEAFYIDLYSPKGLYDIFRDGIMPVPYLWERRDEFKEAVKWSTSLIDGGIKVVDANNIPISPSNRIQNIIETKRDN